MSRYYNDFLMHYGVKGMKWGVRKDDYETYDNSSIDKFYRKGNGKGDRSIYIDDDYGIKKGTRFERVTSSEHEQPLKKGQRMYASRDYRGYFNDYFVGGDPSKSYRVTYEAAHDAKVAGEKSTNRILKEVGYMQLDDDYNPIKGATNRDFMYTDSDVRRKFIDKAIQEGYDAIVDPVDSNNGMGFQESATIFITDVMRKNGQTKLSELM